MIMNQILMAEPSVQVNSTEKLADETNKFVLEIAVNNKSSYRNKRNERQEKSWVCKPIYNNLLIHHMDVNTAF